MKYLYLLSFFITFQISYSQNQPFLESFLKIVEAEKQAHIIKPKFSPNTLIDDYDVLYHRCEWTVNPAIYYIAGKVTTYINPLISALEIVRFDLSNSLTVDSVLYHNTPLAFTHTNNLVSITLPDKLSRGVPDSISVYYKGVPPQTGFGSFDTSSHQGVPVLWTLSEPYGGSDWWPCKNGLSDKADSIDIIINIPELYRAASNGILISETKNGNYKSYHWRHGFPIATYLICMAVTNYAQYTHHVPFENTNTEVLNYIYPEDSATAASQTQWIIPIMQLFDTLFGVYPFAAEKYGHCQFGWGGGMEHQTFTFVGGFSFDLLAHELAHQWFGDKITCGSWQDIWLNEGAATYLTGLCFEHILTDWWRQYKLVSMEYVTSQPGGSVWCNDTTNVGRIFDGRLTYYKGAMILHQLRWVLGDSIFFKALYQYQHDPALAYGFARTSDLIAHFESASGKDLDWYFNDWFTGEGYPIYNIGWSQTGNVINLDISQTQSHPSVPFFELPLPVLLKGQNRDTLLRLDHTFSGQHFSIPVSFQVDSVLFDPELWIIHRDPLITATKETEITGSFSLSPNPAQEFVEIQLSESLKDIQLNLIDSHGKIVFHENKINSSHYKLQLRNLSKGIYFVQIKSEGKQGLRKLVVR